MRLLLIRHGESELNSVGIFQGGDLDPSLSPLGREQARALGNRLKWDGVKSIYSSTLKRAIETAEEIAQICGLTSQPILDLHEFDYGSFTGQPINETILGEFNKIIDRWKAGEIDLPIPGGESPVVAEARALPVMRSLIEKHSADVVAVVAHAQINRVILTSLLGMDLSRHREIHQNNASLSILDINSAQITSVVINDISHLKVVNENPFDRPR
ncbi:MAG: histidine phosphatase family protein [Nitrospira sp.]|nr:histidine phosphatase family protein [Nitrospira sp.]